jgi:predicted Zn-dependent protease
VHQLPQISSDELSMAHSEVKGAGGVPQRHDVTRDDAVATMQSVLGRIRPVADQLCRQVNTGICSWDFRLSGDKAMNAHAGPNGQIVIYRGIFEYAETEEEVAMVVAHEIGHQIANHLVRNLRNQTTGRLVGAILVGAIGGAASYGSRESAAITQAAMNAGGDIGGAVGRIAYSKEQEREADYLSALILYRAGVDLDKARGFQIKMAKRGKTETGLFDRHPAGPERIAAWDRAVQEVRASNGRLPQRQ